LVLNRVRRDAHSGIDRPIGAAAMSPDTQSDFQIFKYGCAEIRKVNYTCGI